MYVGSGSSARLLRRKMGWRKIAGVETGKEKERGS
jgi:hypothetical protein